jgi:hypothetical protein
MFPVYHKAVTPQAKENAQSAEQFQVSQFLLSQWKDSDGGRGLDGAVNAIQM